MHPTTILSLLAAAVAAPLCYAANYHKASPPNVVVLGFPGGDLPANQTLNVGFDGGGSEVAGDYYGFAWNTSVSLVLPNGTHLGGVSVSNVPSSGPASCKGSGASQGPSADNSLPNAYGAYYNETANVGAYKVIWNVTYGTSTDSAVANQTSCDLSRLSYESFLFTKTINIVAPTSNNPAIPGNSKEAHTFQPKGFIMSNGAGFATSSVAFVLAGVLCTLLQVL